MRSSLAGFESIILCQSDSEGSPWRRTVHRSIEQSNLTVQYSYSHSVQTGWDRSRTLARYSDGLMPVEIRKRRLK